LIKKMNRYIKSGGKTWTFGDDDTCPLCLYAKGFVDDDFSGWKKCYICPMYSNGDAMAPGDCFDYSPPRWKIKFRQVDEGGKYERYRRPFIKAARKDFAKRLKAMMEKDND